MIPPPEFVDDTSVNTLEGVKNSNQEADFVAMPFPPPPPTLAVDDPLDEYVSHRPFPILY